MEDVVGLLALVFIVLTVVELAVLIQVGQALGVLNTIGILVLVSVVGAWLVRREGMAVWTRFQRQVQTGVVPGREIADGVLILLAGALLCTPGFVTDVVGILLLLPPVRSAVRSALLYRAGRRFMRVERG
ncbi:MAG TPA: FxsA family protein [Acidimicrobiales bacterium]|nr:FxsA family protein [Acidimicrobiales bacterium]